MSRIFSEDKSMFATFGKSKDGTHSATLHMGGFGDDYPAFGISKSEGFTTREDAVRWATMAMDAELDEVPA